MERIFHQDLLSEFADISPGLDGDQVRLNRQHLWLSGDLAKRVFNNERQVYTVYYPQRKALLIAPMSNDAFKTIHQCSLVMLKDRNMQGDKSLSLQEIIIDNGLDEEDRPLAFSTIEGLQLLQVILGSDE
jgi:hypothetical protein